MNYPAARIHRALSPRHRPLAALATFERFAVEVEREAGPEELARIVRSIERNAVLTGRAVA